MIILSFNVSIAGKLGSDKNKKTVCVYGHLDVQPAALEDGWDSEPFVLTERDNKLYGRGSSDDKGPAIGWLHVAQAYKSLGLELPVNLWVCIRYQTLFRPICSVGIVCIQIVAIFVLKPIIQNCISLSLELLDI